MGWDPVPWMVGGGAQHSAEVARVLAYVACRGNEGIVGSGDLRVKALNVPDGAVTVDPGACSILCRATGQLHQAYTGRVTTVDGPVAIPATTSSGGRSDLVIARVEDPFLSGEPWPDPTDETVGPYIRTRVIPNVGASTTTLAQLGLGQSGIELARIDIPASTGTITQAMIKDLRKIANPRRERRLDLVFRPSGQVQVTNATPVTLGTSAAIKVPLWATAIKMSVIGSGLQVLGANIYGALRAVFGGSIVSANTVFDENWAGSSFRTTYVVGGEAAIPAAMRGTSQTLALQGWLGSGFTGQLQADAGTTISVDVEFTEVAE
ncbi:hypothetical protein JNW90_01470 [Micromonospora sp. STR1s_5]|nr:hypothetical protein [Micromonospora sp. STR1s_5]